MVPGMVTNKQNPNLRFGFCLFGGDGGIRTLDLTDANRTLSQLSYAPTFIELFFRGLLSA